jgi:hypothetical protein
MKRAEFLLLAGLLFGCKPIPIDKTFEFTNLRDEMLWGTVTCYSKPPLLIAGPVEKIEKDLEREVSMSVWEWSPCHLEIKLLEQDNKGKLYRDTFETDGYDRQRVTIDYQPWPTATVEVGVDHQ